MKKTLGGERVGSGNKMQVELHGYERSSHDLGYTFRTTMSAGTLVPFMKYLALPGDTFDIDLETKALTHPTIGPAFGSFKVQLDVYMCPVRLYQGKLHNNKLGIGLKMSDVKLPRIRLDAPSILGVDMTGVDIDNSQINPSCILSYLGIRGIGTNRDSIENIPRYFNAVPWLAYWDIYKNYYANKQEEKGAVIHSGVGTIDNNVGIMTYNGGALPQMQQGQATPRYTVGAGANLIELTNSGTFQDPNDIVISIFDGTSLRWIPLMSTFTQWSSGTPQAYSYTGEVNVIYIDSWAYKNQIQSPTIEVVTFDLKNLDDVREDILVWTNQPTPYDIDNTSPEPFGFMYQENFDATVKSALNSQEGLAVKTYQSDLFNNWLSTEWIDGAQGISEITAVDTTAGSFTMDTLALAKKVYDMLNRIAVSGGTYDDWLDAVYTTERYTRAESPIYMGGLSKELVFEEVVSNAQSEITDSTKQPLGTLAGKGVMHSKHKGGQVTIKVDEPSYIIGIVSLTPRLDYSQGNDWDMHLETVDDFHKPALDEIGFQELITEQMAWWTTHWDDSNGLWITKSAGKQPAWINYMTDVNRVRGNFAVKDNENFMVLTRNYEPLVSSNQIQIKDLTTYVDPRLYNKMFAYTALDAQNFWVQIGVNTTARRKISAKIMPNL